MALDHSLVETWNTPISFTYTWKDAVLYALGIGAKKDELDYLYEGRGPKVIPSFAVVPAFPAMFERVAKSGGNLSMVVHGAQRVRLRQALPPGGTLSTIAKIRGIYDMRKFAILLVDTETKDATGNVLFDTTSQIIFRGEGGFGVSRRRRSPRSSRSRRTSPRISASKRRPRPSRRCSTASRATKTRSTPIPSSRRASASIKGPILHGLCTYGYMVRHVAKGACGGDATKIRGFEGQFRRPVWPGDTLVTEGWEVAPGKIALQVSVKERNENVLTGAWATTADASG